jgi:hypothetical protein
MTQSLSRHVSRLTVGLASLLLMSAATFGSALAQTTVDAVSPAETISTTNTLVSVPVTITRTSSTPVLGFSIDFTVSPELTLPSGTGSISIGGFLSADGGATNFQVIDHGGGNYTADGVTLGLPCGSSALTGTLFSVTAGSATASGSGTVTITGVTLRDCSNAPLAASIGTSATVNIDNTLPAVAVTAPNSGEFWVVGSTHDITWTATDAAGIDAAGIDLEYSTDNGGAWTSIATSLANSGTHAWVVPNDPSTTALVRATARDVNGNSAQDASDAVFTIGYYVITVTQGTNGVIAPTGPVNVVYDGTQAFTITPDPGYHTTDVLVDGGSVGVVPGYTFNNVVADHTITATFAQNELSIDDVSVNESAGTATFTVSLNAPVPTGQTVTVDHATSDGTAAAPGDYTAITTTTLTFLPGEITKPVSVTILDDLLDEADETFTVDLSNASNATIATGTGTGTITNDDAAPSLSVDDVSVTEGDAGTVNATFTVTLSAPSGQTVTVDHATANGTAVAPGDYTAIATTPLTFLPGETTKPVVVVVNGDVTSEADETFTLNLTNAVNATIATGTGTGTIFNDDALGDLAAAQQTTGNDADGSTRIALTFTAPAGVAAVEVYRAGYGAYPEYDDDGGVAPPAPGAHPPSGPWTLTGVTATGQTDEPAARDFYYYVAYTQNGGGAWSPPSNVTTGSLNYHLGDVSDGITTGQGDNLVSTEDISLLGSSYGIALGALDPVGYLDVGPTTDLSVGARPTTDNVINFEDLVLFAINYGVASAPQAALAPVTATGRANALVLRAPEHVAAGGEIELELTASGNGLVQALSVGLSWDPAVVAPAGFTSGAMIDEQNGVVLSAKPGTLDAALLGRGRAGLAGEGTIARMRFRVLADGDPKFAIAALDARDGSNQKVSMAASTGVIPRPAPLTTSLSGAIPNPSRRSATIVFGLARGGPTEVSLYSVDGRRVRVLARGFREAGEYRMEWDGRDDGGRPLSPGAYFIRMVTPGAQFTRKLTFLR